MPRLTRAQNALDGDAVRVRMGIHTGEPVVTDEGYVGVDVHRAARVMSAGHGGQVVISETTARLLDSTARLQRSGRAPTARTSARRSASTSSETATFPPLRTLYRTNLPDPVATALVGRQRELAQAGGVAFFAPVA